MRRLLSLRYSLITPRFETMLQTTRRFEMPQDEEALATVLVRKGAQESFFARAFSNSISPRVDTNPGSSLLLRHLRQRQRFVGEDDYYVTRYDQMLTRFRLKARLEARGRLGNTYGGLRAISNARMDPRFLRVKSARSRQYLLRLPGTTPKKRFEVIRKLNEYRARQQQRALTDYSRWLGAGAEES